MATQNSNWEEMRQLFGFDNIGQKTEAKRPPLKRGRKPELVWEGVTSQQMETLAQEAEDRGEVTLARMRRDSAARLRKVGK